jgi:hypothetical protein
MNKILTLKLWEKAGKPWAANVTDLNYEVLLGMLIG